ncbi:uncharacterized protein VP01_7370g1, partial [Puccinia sorghi]
MALSSEVPGPWCNHSPNLSSGSDQPPSTMDALNTRLDKMMHKHCSPSDHHPKLHSPCQASLSTEPMALRLSHFFPTDSRKLVFAISFMMYLAATWSQPYLTKVFNGEEVVFSEFINDFKSSFFNHKRQK